MMEVGPNPPEVLARGRHLRFVSRRGWEYVERPGISGIVVILAVTDRGGLVLVSQWREPVGARVVELPAGLAGDRPGDSREPLESAAKRELLEETGFQADRVVPVLSGPPSPGICSEVVTFFRAHGLRRIGPGGGETGEGVRAHVVPLSRLDDWAARLQACGVMMDPKVLAGLYLLGKEKE